ncbi:MAG TPA: ribosome maturation factor RimM [Rhodocyclaceae bacterium]|nr:ribosome maturation factor RimM [Rhodocyclaceae bacterium]
MIVLGRVVAPHGVLGWVKIRPFGDDPGAWRGMPQWWLGADAEGDAWQPFEVEGFRQQGAFWIAKLAGIDDRNGAEGLDGRFIAAPRQSLPDTGKDEYYWADLIGLMVMNEQGESLGCVDSLIQTGAHQVLVVKDGESERLLPFVGHVVKDVDVSGGRILVAWGLDW